MFQQLAAALYQAPAGRVRVPVRRSSRTKSRCEGVFWRSTSRQEVRQIVVAAKRYELTEKQAGNRNGPLGYVAIEVLELFANLVDFRTGRLEPSLNWIMGKLRRSKDAVVSALKALRTHGFLDWLRRYEPTSNEGRGPQVKQASNAYRMSLPERARQILGKYAKAPPLPDDWLQAEIERLAELEAHKAMLTPTERVLSDMGDSPLAQSLARLGEFIKQRESAKQTESLYTLLDIEADGLSDCLLSRPTSGQADARKR